MRHEVRGVQHEDGKAVCLWRSSYGRRVVRAGNVAGEERKLTSCSPSTRSLFIYPSCMSRSVAKFNLPILKP